MSYGREVNVVDPTDGIGLEKLGSFISRYPDFCPFCFSKYPENSKQRHEHINRCARLAKQIRYEARPL